jgi:hypothetical protein
MSIACLLVLCFFTSFTTSLIGALFINYMEDRKYRAERIKRFKAGCDAIVKRHAIKKGE